MHKLINERLYDEAVTYQILGGERQTLQIVLMPGQSIITKRGSLMYASENIVQGHVVPSLLLRIMKVSSIAVTRVGLMFS